MEIEKKAGFDASKPFVVPILSGGEPNRQQSFETHRAPVGTQRSMSADVR